MLYRKGWGWWRSRGGGRGGVGGREGETFFFGFGFCWFALPMLALAYSKKRRLDIKGRD